MSHLRLRLAVVIAVLVAFSGLGLAFGAAPAEASASGVVISEFRTRGPVGGNDEFVELRNAGSVAVNISGWLLQGCSSGTPGAASTRVAVPAGVTLAPGQSYLFANTTSPGYSGGVNADTTYGTGFTDFSASNFAGIRIAEANGTVQDGVGAPNSPCREGIGFSTPAPNGDNSFERVGGTTDANNNLSDFQGPKAGNPQNFGDAAPTVASTDPAANAGSVARGSNVTVTFSEPVDVAAGWYSISCATSGAHSAAASGGPTAFVLNPTTDFAANESCTVRITAANVTDQDANDPPNIMAADHVFSFQTADVAFCGDPATPIPAIQGDGAASPMVGSTRTIEGVVVGDYEGASPGLRGFYVQAAVGDGNAATSDGIFVFNGGNQLLVDLGDTVRVTGTVGENQGQTQISTTAGNITECGTGSVEPTDVTFPVAAADTLERYEGMLVRTPQTLYVTEHFQLGRFGQVVLSSGGRLFQPTALVAPGAAAAAMQADNNLNRLILDDSTQAQNPDPIVFGRNGQPLSASNTLRGGDTLTGAVGVMTYTWAGDAASGNAYRLRPLNALGGSARFVAANPRPAQAPEVGGTLKIVGMNLLNFFNTFDGSRRDGCLGGVSGGVMDCRGADDASEFARQWPKTVAAMIGTGGDIIGLGEIENDGYGPNSAIQFLVDKLNEATAPGTYAFIDVDTKTGQVDALGSDAIKVGLIFKTAKVTPVGTTAALNSFAFQSGGDPSPRNRPALAQAFRQTSNGAVLVVSPNHLKSKGSACTAPDSGDGQANCAGVRTNAANLLADWLNADPTGTGSSNVLIVGDLNSYAKEDPIVALEEKGFTNLVAAKLGPHAYSYVFDGQWGYLDYAMGNAGILSAVTGVAEWHIDADEPAILDYNVNFKSPGQIASLYAPDEFRVSDHDPVVVGLNLNVAPTASAGGPYTVAEGSSVNVTATATDPDGGALTYAWDLDNDGAFDDAVGTTAIFSAAAIDGPAPRTVRVRATDAGGLTATSEAVVTVTNVAPTATFVAPATSLAGTPFALALTNATDAAPADRVGLTYAFDCGTGYGAYSTTSTATCPTDAVGTRNVGGKVRDDDGGETEYRSTVSVGVTFASLCALVESYVDKEGVAHALCSKLEAAEGAAARGNENAKNGSLGAFVNQVEAQSGKSMTATAAATLIRLAGAL